MRREVAAILIGLAANAICMFLGFFLMAIPAWVAWLGVALSSIILFAGLFLFFCPNCRILRKINLNAEKYSFPFPNAYRVGINITNREAHDLTDIDLRLTELRKSQYGASGESRSIQVRLDKAKCRFDLGDDLNIGAKDKRPIVLGEKRDNEFFLLLKEPYNPDHEFAEQQPGINMPDAIWELAFELHGKIEGNRFRKVMFETRIGAMMGAKKPDWGNPNIMTLEIGEIRHVEQKEPGA
jgi:hypothetical protein